VVDILVNNAGLIMNDRLLNEKGIETMMAINHFGHFYLTYLLFPRIKTAPEARIINVSSSAHKQTNLNTAEDLGCEQGFSSFDQYCRSKLANVQFTVGLAEKISKYPNVKTMSLHPGLVETGFGPDSTIVKFFKCCCCLCFVKADTGATTNLFLCRLAFEQLRSGQYYDNDTSIV
jgi:NAD(P)-dependent dehydrogenase (short-subunit alcohol dehydrogenase family)